MIEGIEVILVKPPKNMTLRDKAVTYTMESCTGCRNCVIACSYHHKRVFSRAISSLDITRPGDTHFEITVYGVDADHLACDRCAGSGGPLCVKYCPSIARPELTNFLREAWRGLGLA